MLVFLPLDGGSAGLEGHDVRAAGGLSTAPRRAVVGRDQQRATALPLSLPRPDATSARLPAGVPAAALRRLGITPLPGPADPTSHLPSHDARESHTDLDRAVR